MKRIAAAVTIVVALIAAGGAYAAINTYTAGISFTGRQAGTARKPVPIGYTENLKVSGTKGNRAGVQLVIRTRIYGLVEDGRDFPRCTVAMIGAAHTDAGCPKAAEVATGNITAALGSAKDFTSPGQACDPELHVWNGGPGKLTFFFVETPSHQCLGGSIKTGGTPPYPATYNTQGKYLNLTVPVPDSINYPLGRSGGLVGSLESEHLTYFKRTRRVHGRTVAITTSVGCQRHKRPYSASFTSTLPPAGPATQTSRVTESAPC